MSMKSRRILTIMFIIKAILGLLFLLGFIFTFAGNFLFLALFHGVWGLVDLASLRADKASAGRAAVAELVTYITLSVVTFVIPGLMTFGIITPFKWQYRFQMMYIMTEGVPSKYFPDSIPHGAKGYRLEFLPTIMQGDGHLNVSFKDAEYVSEVSENIRSRSLQTYTLSEYPDCCLGMEWPIDVPSSVRTEHPDGELYFLSSNNYGNHPRGTAVIIDDDFIMYINM